MTYKLPEGWEEVELGEIAKFKNGKKAQEIKESGTSKYPLYGGNGQYGSVDEYNSENSLVIGRVGAYCGSVHKVDEKLWISDNAIEVKPISVNKTAHEYLYYRLDSFNLNRLHQGTSQPLLNQTILKNITFILPPLPEQKVIADTLSALDDKIENNIKINEKLEQQAQAIFKHWFVDFEFPDKNKNPYKSSGGEMVESELGIIPKGWEVLVLNDASTLSAGGDKPKIVSEVKTCNCKVPIYSNGISKNGLYGYTNTAKIKEESVTVSARGTIGFVCLRSEPFVPIVRLITLIPKTEYISAKYLYFAIKQMNILGTGTTQQQLTIPAFKTSPLLIPKINIMEKYTKIINTMFNQIDTNDIENQKLSTLRDILLPKLMSGEIRIPLD